MMPSYDDDRPTMEEEDLFKRLNNDLEQHQRIEALIQLKNSIIGSKRSKTAFYHVGILEILSNLLKEYSSPEHVHLLIEILDCLSSFAKSPNEQLFNRLIELSFIEQLLHLLTFSLDSQRFYESLLRCLRAFYLPKHHSNVLSTSLSLHSSNEFRTKSFVDERTHSIDLLFEHSQILAIFTRLLPLSPSIQISIIEILCCACVNNDRQNEIIEQNFLPVILDILIDNLDHHHQINEYLLGLSLKFFCSISFENPNIAQQLSNLSSKTNRNLYEIISGLLQKVHRPLLISYYASKYFIHLCKTKVLSIDDPNVSNQSLTTLIHLCMKSSKNRCVSLYVECLHTLIYFLNGNCRLHHSAMYTEQFLKKLLVDIANPRKVFGEDLDEDIRAAIFTFMAVLSSYHEDIKKRIAEQENLISLAIECYRSSNYSLKLSTLRLFHGLSRSVQQLRTTFNDSISDILLDAIKSTDFLIVHTASSVISNSVLEFSICRERLLSGGILDILLSLIAHSNKELAINSIWAIRNLSYLCTLKIKQDIINGLTIDQIYSLLEECMDKQFLLCLLTLLRNLFTEKDREILLPMFDTNKLLTTLKTMLEKNHPEEINEEVNLLLDYLNSPLESHSSPESLDSTYRISFRPEDEFYDMDHLDCSQI